MIERLFDENLIDSKQATLWYRYLHHGSGLIFGDHSMGYYKNEETFKYDLIMMANITNIQPNTIWALNLTDTLFNNISISNGQNFAIIDPD